MILINGCLLICLFFLSSNLFYIIKILQSYVIKENSFVKQQMLIEFNKNSMIEILNCIHKK